MRYQSLLVILLCGLTACEGGRNSGSSADNSDPVSAGPDPVSGVNLAPIANPDSVVVPMNVPSAIDVLANDSDPEGDSLKITVVSQPANGVSSIDDNGTTYVYDDVIIYQPSADYSGSDEFSYVLYDGKDGTASGTVQISVGGNEFSVSNRAKADSAVTEIDTSVSIDVLANDISIGLARISAFTQPAHGNVVLDDAGTTDTADDLLIFSPSAGHTGFDSFTYTLNDDGPAAVNITVNDSGSGILSTPANNGLSGRIIKGPVAAAVVALYPIAPSGVEDRSLPLYQTVTDVKGYWTTPLPAQTTNYLVVSSGGYYFDEAHSGAEPVAIGFDTTEEWSSVLPATETFAVTSVFSSALYLRSLVEAVGGNFSAVYAQNRSSFAAAAGVDVVAVDPVDPANPDLVNNSAQSIAYGMQLGGAAESINQISLILGLSAPDYPVIMAVVDDLTDCWLDGQGITGPVSVNLPSASVAMPASVNLNTQILRFRNNRADQYSGASLAQIDSAPCQASGVLPDVSAPVFATTSSPLFLGGATASGISVSDPRISLFLTGTTAIDDRDGAIAVGNNAPAVFFPGSTIVTFSATDSAGNTSNVTATATLTIAVNTAPSALLIDNSIVTENNMPGTLIGTLTTTDAEVSDTHTYSLVVGAGDGDNVLFGISGNSLLISTATDFETRSTYTVRVQTTDPAGGSFSRAIGINVIDQNDAPTSVMLGSNAVDENQAVGTVVANLSSTDVDAGDSFGYALIAGIGDSDNAQFSIVGSQLLTASVFDFETVSSYSVRIQATDAGGAIFSNAFALSVNDLNDGPTAVLADSTTVDENQAIGTVVANLSSTDADTGDAFSYTLVAGSGDSDNAQFSIVGSQLMTAAVFDVETLSSYSVRIQTTDAGGTTFADAFTISVNNLNEAPTAVLADNTTVDENQAVGTVVANLSSTDVDTGDSFSYVLVAGTGDADNVQFSIVGSQLLTASVFDFEAVSSYSVRIQTTDAGGTTFADAFTISVNNLNEAPTAVLEDNTTVDENQALGTVVASLSSTDVDTGDSFNYALVAGTGDADNVQFSIVGNQLLTASVFDFETLSSYSVRIQTTDASGTTFADAFTISVNNLNEAPTAVLADSTTIDENQAVGMVVANLSSTDVDTGDSFSYALVVGTGDTDNAQFSIVGSQLLTAAGFDFETLSSYSVRIQTTDAGGATFADAFTINVNNLNEAPTAVLADNTTVYENQASGTVVANLNSTDVDTGDSFSYALVVGAGDSDNAQFSIVGSQLLTAAVFDFESLNSYSVRIQTTDAGGATFTDVFAISVNDLSETLGDVDSDGLSDTEEIALQGTFAGDPACPYTNNADSDGDLISDSAEVRAGGNPCAVDPSQTIYYVDPTGTWPGSTTNLPSDPVPANSTVPNYVLIKTGVYNSEISPSSACDNLHYVGSQNFSQPGVIQSDPVTKLPTTTIDMQNTRFSLANGCLNMVLQDIALTNGVGDVGRGGGIRAVNGATLLLERVHIHNNAANDQGGGIGVSNAGTVVNVRDSLIENNSVAIEKGGGGAWVGNGATLNLKNTRVRGNAALGSGGGGLYFDHGTTGLIEDSWIIDNTAAVHGGGIEIDHTFAVSASISIVNTVISGNSAGGEGGGININQDGSNGSVFTITDSQVTGNYAVSNGGGIGLTDTDISTNLHNVLIVGNYSVGSGAGLYTFGGNTDPVLQNLTLALNKSGAASGGGALSAFAGTPVVRDSILWNNRAGDRAINAAPTAGDNYRNVTNSDFNLLEIDKLGASDIDFVNDGVQPFFTQAYYLDQSLSPAINTGNDTAGNLGLDAYFTGAVADGGQIDRGFHYVEALPSPADGYQETSGTFDNQVTVQDAENGANAERLSIEPLLGGLPIGPGRQVVATLEGVNIALAQLIPVADVDPLSDGESALLVDQGDNTYAVDLHAVGVAPGTTNISLRVFVDGIDLGMNVTIVRDN